MSIFVRNAVIATTPLPYQVGVEKGTPRHKKGDTYIAGGSGGVVN